MDKDDTIIGEDVLAFTIHVDFKHDSEIFYDLLGREHAIVQGIKYLKLGAQTVVVKDAYYPFKSIFIGARL